MQTEDEFEILDHTADVAIRAYGNTLEKVFASAARAMFSLIAELESIRESLFREVEVAAQDREMLLVEWLNELVYLFDVELVLFKRFEITNLTETSLKARCYGEAIDRTRHEIKIGIKAATYHMLKIEKNGGFCAQVLFDI